ncbi:MULTISPECIES: lipid-A-disaccharide synthase [Mesorhizobium]|uniref:Lipid-A-disaccharide synthase n=1 Tax=Mesorhizobium denitrificans TaxID=2294114 RepID=A0A371XDD9_9HYPH|nr:MULTISPECIES: lipid-A-disaccharide synthase [Mesorhizobium]RFC67235.1 lipid-A-disaccharide synthase [Mesorhizobium denitrificans]
MSRPLKIAVIAGEESGELLAADLIRALQSNTQREIKLIGVGGHELSGLGLKSLFPSSDIALMGLSAIVKDLPRLISRIGSTARYIAAEQPDCLITVDSPDFNLRVAAKVRASAPKIPIIHYVCPSVWAWRPGRARAMRPYVDHILCLLPFEPEELVRLGGPPGTFVGHRLSHYTGILKAARRQREKSSRDPAEPAKLLLLPGSRKGEVRALIEPFREIVEILHARGRKLEMVLPTVSNVAALVQQAVSAWPEKPKILLGQDEKWGAFGEADAALIASGTVALELALSDVPMISTYKLDPVARVARKWITAWSASLPNLIADRVVVPEYIDEMLRPAYVARQLESLMDDTAFRQWQKQGFDEVRHRMQTARPSGELAAEVVLQSIAK